MGNFAENLNLGKRVLPPPPHDIFPYPFLDLEYFYLFFHFENLSNLSFFFFQIGVVRGIEPEKNY